MKILYRYEIDYKNSDQDTDVVLRKYPVLRETEATYFIDPHVIGIPREAKKRVSKTAYNTFAFETIQKARDHFMRRTRRRIAWFEYWKEECEKALEIMKQMEVNL